MRYIIIAFLFFITLSYGQGKNTKNCQDLLTELIYTSNIHNRFKVKSGIEQFIARVDRIDSKEMTIGFYIKDTRESIVAWVVFKSDKQQMLDETRDPDNPIILTYNKDLWNKVAACYFYERIEIDGLFNESSIIRFTPKDLNKNEPIIQEFKKRFELYEAMNFKGEDFTVTGQLSLLISNKTFSNNEGFIDNSWLEYFVTKYKFSQNIINELMDMAIDQEDFLAVKTLTRFYVFSEIQIKNARERKKYKDTLNGKLDIENYYDPVYSTIDEILPYVTYKYESNKISDPDGYTNLRKGKNTNTDVIAQIKTGEHIKVLDNTGNWLLVETMDGKKGYVYRNRIKSE